jgi:hypothetical protein
MVDLYPSENLKDELFIKLNFCLEVIGFGHIWDKQETFSKLRTLSAITDKLQNRFLIFGTNYCYHNS